MNKIKFLRHLIPTSALVLGSSFAGPSVFAQPIAGAVAEAQGDAIKVMLKDLDREIDRLDEMIESAPAGEEKATAKLRLASLKSRRAELRKSYAQSRYDGLRADVKTEYGKVAAWTKKTFSSSAESKLERKMDRAGDKMKEAADDTAQAAREMKAGARTATNASNVATTADIAAYKVNPSDENKADVKASLATLDAEIDRLEARVDNLPKGNERDSTKLRVKALKDRRSELASNFRKARYDALKADISSEWNKITK